MADAFPRRVAADIHRAGCDCPTCEPYVPSRPRFRHAAELTLAQFAIGLGLAGAIIWTIDFATAGPGVLVVFGL